MDVASVPLAVTHGSAESHAGRLSSFPSEVKINLLMRAMRAFILECVLWQDVAEQVLKKGEKSRTV